MKNIALIRNTVLYITRALVLMPLVLPTLWRFIISLPALQKTHASPYRFCRVLPILRQAYEH